MLYELEAAYRPELTGELDTQNFMKYNEVISISILNHCFVFPTSFASSTEITFVTTLNWIKEEKV